MRFLLSLFLCLGLLRPLSAGEPDPVEASIFNPNEKWILSEAGDGCEFKRRFYHDGESITLVMSRVHPGGAIQYGLFGEVIEYDDEPVLIGFRPPNLARYELIARASVGSDPGIVFAGTLFPGASSEISDSRPVTVEDIEEMARETRHLTVAGVTDKPFALRTGPLDAALRALDECVERKLTGLGLDLTELENAQRNARPVEMETLVERLQSNYPREALSNRWSGMLALRVIVDPTGKPAHCHLANHLAARVLRERACAIMLEHARFEPALDEAGQPITGFAIQPIRYVISKASPFSSDAHGFMIRGEE